MAVSLTLAVEALAFLIVALAAFAVLQELTQTLERRRRLGDQGAVRALSTAPVVMNRSLTNPLLLWVQASTSINDSRERQKLRMELSLAGFDDPAAPIWYVIARFLLALGLPLVFLLGRALLAVPMTSSGVIFWSLALCGVGLIAPRTLLDRRVAARRTQLEYEFPDALDLIVVCVEAGLSLEAALVRVRNEVRNSHPRIAQEFGILSDQLRAGQSRAEALRAFGNHAGVPVVKSFAALVIQTEALGTSIAQTLRTYSAEMRETRFLKGEEKALRIPVLMTIPLVACILPVIMGALLLPAIIDVTRVMLPAMSHHQAGH